MSFQNIHCPLGKCHNRIRRLTRCKDLFWGQNEDAVMSCWAYHLLIKNGMSRHLIKLRVSILFSSDGAQGQISYIQVKWGHFSATK